MSVPPQERTSSSRPGMSAKCQKRIMQTEPVRTNGVAGGSVVHSVVGRKQPVVQELIRGARPRFVGVAAEVCAHRDHEFPGMDVVDVNVHVKDKVGDLL